MSKDIAVTGIRPDQVLRALAVGMFPMASTRAGTIDWIEPRTRAILPLDGFRCPSSLRQRVRSERFAVTADQAFGAVVAACAEVTPARVDTWISPEIEAVCTELHRRGLAHSVECWRDGRLVGGVYGIALGGLFSIESMFRREADASKVAMAHLVARLRLGGCRLVDCQFVSPHMASQGAVPIEQPAYRKLLDAALRSGDAEVGAPTQAPPVPFDFFALDRAFLALSSTDVDACRPGAFVLSELAKPHPH